MHSQGFGDGITDGDAGVQARIGVLEDNLEAGAQDAHLVAAQAVEGTATVGDAAVAMVYEAQQSPAEGALAAAALAHKAQGLALKDVEGDAIHPLEGLQGLAKEAALEGIGHREVPHGDERGVGGLGWMGRMG